MEWSKSMQQTFEFFEVDPNTWRDTEQLLNVRACTISRDSSVETLGSASFDIEGSIGECYIRTYLVSNQNGVTDRRPLGTHLVQTPTLQFNGKYSNVSIDAYTPLLELKENQVPIGYFIREKENIMDYAYKLTKENMRAPVIRAYDDEKLASNFVSNSDDTWLVYISDLLANAKYEYDLDEKGQILFAPIQEIASLTPVWEYNDDNSSILYPEITIDRDLYGIPNVVEIVSSGSNGTFYGEAVNDDVNSPVSTVSRGRRIVHRVVNPEVSITTTTQAKDYAKKLLKNLSSLEYTIKYSHGYCPVRLGDCVRLNYKRAGLTDIKAKVTSQSICCKTGCKVTETAVFTTDLWG